MDNFKFNIVGERTEYSWQDGEVFWWDCGWEYSQPCSENRAVSCIGNGEWVVIKGDCDE